MTALLFVDYKMPRITKFWKSIADCPSTAVLISLLHSYCSAICWVKEHGEGQQMFCCIVYLKVLQIFNKLSLRPLARERIVVTVNAGPHACILYIYPWAEHTTSSSTPTSQTSNKYTCIWKQLSWGKLRKQMTISLSGVVSLKLHMAWSASEQLCFAGICMPLYDFGESISWWGPVN